jgi:hypothetical protein
METKKIDLATLTINEVTVNTPDDEENLIKMFVELFPEDRRYVGFIRQRVQSALEPNPDTITHQWVVKHGENAVGFRLFSYLRHYNVGVSGYIGVSRPYHGMGIGGWIHKRTIEQVKIDAVRNNQEEPFGFCGEVDRPSAANNELDRRLREERIAIFKRMGALVYDFGYLEPLQVEGMPITCQAELEKLEPDSMLVYVVPFQVNKQPTREEITNMVKGMLLITYRLDENNYYYIHALQGIETKLTQV